MAGVKGKSGGARPGAGRKPKEPEVSFAPKTEDPKEYLLSVMNDNGLDVRARLDAAKSLMPFMHTKLGEGGKKDEKARAAKSAGAGKFSAAPPPKLKLVS